VNNKTQTYLLFLISILFGMKLFFWSSIFPFYGNVDEKAHFDLITKYGNGEKYLKIPLPYSKDAVDLISNYQSDEYLRRVDSGTEYDLLLDFIYPPKQEDARLFVQSLKNYQNNSPPLYYWITGAYYWLAGINSESSIDALYSLRWFSSGISLLFFVCFVWFLKRNMGTTAALSASILLLCFPQPVYYFLNNDVLSLPLITFAILLSWNSKRNHVILSSILMGLAVWNKLSNLALVAIPPIIYLLSKENKQQKFKTIFSYSIVLGIIILPLFLWNYNSTGTFTANAEKISILKWGENSFEDMLNHPIRTWEGLKHFLWFPILSLMRGEVTWRLYPIIPEWMDYLIVVLVILSLLYLAWKRKSQAKLLQSTYLATLFAFSFLTYLSLVFDYTESVYPSAKYPFFTSGRILIGIFPFFILAINEMIMGIGKKLNISPIYFSIALGLVFIITEYHFRKMFIYSPINFFGIL
tara:strand:+ start:4353 stop:5756 length:1404 start_codon:yes stop_codon:yes gene_type:complete